MPEVGKPSDTKVVQPVSISSSNGPMSGPMPLVNGEQFTDLLALDSLAGWTTIEGKADSWEVKDGVLSCLRPGGGWLRTNQSYSDFTLQFECRLSAGANTGIGFRFPMTGNPTLTGLELQLLDDASPKYASLRPDQYSGSLYYLQAPATPAGTEDR